MLLDIWVFDKGVIVMNFLSVSVIEKCSLVMLVAVQMYMTEFFLIGCRNESRRTRGSAADSQSQSPYRERVQLYVPCE